MKLTIPGILVTALIVASPVAFAQNYSGTTSKPAASVAKDDSTNVTKPTKKHTTSYKHRHHAKANANAKAMGSKAQQTTGSGSSSAPGASVNKQ
jgi:curli biogenesis system outer membrane secretion channel CsgG